MPYLVESKITTHHMTPRYINGAQIAIRQVRVYTNSSPIPSMKVPLLCMIVRLDKDYVVFKNMEISDEASSFRRYRKFTMNFCF